MKNILTVDREQAARNYAVSQMEYLNCSIEGLHIDEFACEMARVAEDVQALVSADLEESRLAFRRVFQEGHTIAMLPHDLVSLEKWSEAKEEFQVIVFTADGRPVGCFDQDQVQW